MHRVFCTPQTRGVLALNPSAVNVSYPTVSAARVAEVVDGVAVLCIDGPLVHRAGCGWLDYESIAVCFKACLDDGAVREVVLKFDSPGGEVAGLNETVAAMQGMKIASGKRVTGYVDESCYSAAYALAMVCDEVWMPASAGVGSIGVITSLVDVTGQLEAEGVRVEVVASGEQKTDGHPMVPMTDAAIARTKGMVADLAEAFFEIVSRARGITVDAVRALDAGILIGQAAVDAGLADGICSFPFLLTPRESRATLAGTPQSKGKSMTIEKKEASALVVDGKVTKTKTVVTDTHEEEVDDGMPEEPKEEPKGEDVPADEGEEEMPDDEEDEESAAVAAREILAIGRSITGESKSKSILAGLRAMAAEKGHAATLQARVDALEAAAKNEKLKAIVAGGIRAGKLAPGQKSWAMGQTPEALKAFLASAPTIVRPKAEEMSAALAPAEHDELTADELAMCAAANPPVDPAKYAATKAAIKARSTAGRGVR